MSAAKSAVTGCHEYVSYGTAGGTRPRELCAQHTKETMIGRRSRRSSVEGRAASGRGQVGSTSGGVSSNVGTSEKRRVGAPPSTPAGASSADQSTRPSKGAHETIHASLAPFQTESKAVAGRGSGRTASSEVPTGDHDAVKVELPMPCKTGPSKAADMSSHFCFTVSVDWCGGRFLLRVTLYALSVVAHVLANQFRQTF